MALTTQQLASLKADILADPILAAEPMNDDGHFDIAAAYNLPASPSFTVWKTAVSTSDVKDVVNWTEFIGRTAGERDAFQFLLSNEIINPSSPNVRQGIQDMFSGPSGVTSRAAIFARSKRGSTRAEKLFASGTGSDGSPATMSFEGNLSYADVSAARNS